MSVLRKFSNSPIKASSIIGTNVVNRQEETLGSIKEIVIDPRTGKVVYAVVRFGGFFGLGEKLFAIPFAAFEYKITTTELVGSEYILNVSKERMEKAPGFDADHWPLLSDEKWHRAVHSYFERPPYWE